MGGRNIGRGGEGVRAGAVWTTCEASGGKRGYPTRKGAREARNGTKGGGTLHVYRCPHADGCNGFHLGRAGKMEPEEYTRARARGMAAGVDRRRGVTE